MNTFAVNSSLLVCMPLLIIWRRREHSKASFLLLEVNEETSDPQVLVIEGMFQIDKEAIEKETKDQGGLLYHYVQR